MLKRSISKIVQFIGLKYVILTLIIIIAGFIVMPLLGLPKWVNLVKPKTDLLLTLLKDGKNQELYDGYAIDSKISFHDFREQLATLNKNIGEINRFKFTGAYSVSEGSDHGITVGYMIYRITLKSGRNVKSYISLRIDSENKSPIPFKIEKFLIKGDNDNGEIFFITFR